MRLLFGDYNPDQPDHLDGGLIDLSNALPTANGFQPVGQFEAITSALPTTCKGAASFVSPTGSNVIIAGTATGLYRQFESGWQEIGSGYSIQGDGRWRFAQFGGLAIATDQADAMVKFNLIDGTTNALGGSPPKFKMLGVVQNFLVGGVMDGDSSAIGWCGENNAEYWTFGSRKSDYNIFPDGGEVTGILSGEFGLILLRNAVVRMTYVGGNVLFRFDKLATNIGCVTVHSVAQFGQLGFWLSDSGFMMWDGSQIIPIGNELVDRTFAALYDIENWPVMSTAIDGRNKTVFWSVMGKIWAYNWSIKKWGVIDQTAEIIFGGVTKTLGIEETDDTVGPDDDDLDFAGLDPFDDPRFQGGDPRFYLFDDSHVMGTLTGSNKAAYFQMRNAELTEGRDTRLRNVAPIIDATGGLTITVEERKRLGDAGTTRTSSALNTQGVIPIRARERYLKMKLSVGAGTDWSFAQGIDAVIVAGGKR